MKAADFRYERPETLDQALALMADDALDVAALAGGQSLMPMMNFRIAQPDMLVDLNGIGGLSGIGIDGDLLRIGAMTRYCDLERSDVITQHAPLIALALPHIAHSAIRNRGTVGGSLALADPAAEMPAVMLALDAVITVTGTAGQRQIPADEFFLGIYETALDSGELVTEIAIPVSQDSDRFGFYELARRHGDYAMAGIAVAIRDEIRIGFFSVADKASRAKAAEAVLTQDLGDIDSAIATLDEIEFEGDLNASARLKRHYAGIVLRRALAGLSA